MRIYLVRFLVDMPVIAVIVIAVIVLWPAWTGEIAAGVAAVLAAHAIGFLVDWFWRAARTR